MSTHILGMSDLTSNQRSALQRLSNSNNHALRLIADLLDFTQARMGRGLPMAMKPLELHKLVAGSLDDLQLAYPQWQISHQRDGTGCCSASADQLVQLIGNLVSNAANHGRPTGPITVRSTVGRQKCSISVHNEGEALRTETLSTLLEPMVRGTERGAAGVGLGLPIVREIARAHGGHVSVDSDVDRGTLGRAPDGADRQVRPSPRRDLQGLLAKAWVPRQALARAESPAALRSIRRVM